MRANFWALLFINYNTLIYEGRHYPSSVIYIIEITVQFTVCKMYVICFAQSFCLLLSANVYLLKNSEFFFLHFTLFSNLSYFTEMNYPHSQKIWNLYSTPLIF